MRDGDVRRYAGQWVAVKDRRVLFASVDEREVTEWLDAHPVDQVWIVRIRAANEPEVWNYATAS